MVRFAILGPVEARDGEQEMPLGGRRQVALLAFLLVHANRAVSTDQLIEALWPGQNAAGAPKRAQVAVGRLRRAIDRRGEHESLRTVSGGYSLQLAAGQLDAKVFEALVRDGLRALDAGEPANAAEHLRQALALWRGPALADVAYYEFAQPEMRRLEELRTTAREARVEADLRLGRHQELVPELESLVGEDPTRERLTGQLMLALYRCGRQTAALDVLRRARAHLVGELGLEPAPALLELQAKILNHDPALEPPGAATAAERDQPAVAGNGRRRAARVPHPHGAMVGRSEDQRALEDLLRTPRTHLVTLTGPGGVGKTRLAIELARNLDADFADGTAFVSLAPLSRPHAASEGQPSPSGAEQRLLAAVAHALEVREWPGRSVAASLAEHLADQQLLLVLDIFEHLVEAAPAVLALVDACSGLTVLVTSREALRVPGEREYPLAPLSLPDASAPRNPERLATVESVVLFVERAQSAQPRFAITGANADAVAHLCIRLDGLPLALELAAARTKVLSPAAMLDRLERRLPLLTGGARTAPERQRTPLEATIAWSYELLSPAERRTFGRLSVFRGGFSLEAAETVCEADLDTVASLVDKSLLRQRDRLLMLQTIRDYAHDRLTASPEADEVARRHAEWILALFQESAPHLYGRDQADRLQALDREQHNLRAALDHAARAGDRTFALGLLAVCWNYWYLRGHYAEGLARLDAALSGAESVDAELRRDVLNGLFVFAWFQGQAERAAPVAAESLRLRAGLPENRGLRQSLINAGLAAAGGDALRTAERLLSECVERSRRLGEDWCAAVALTNLADVQLRHGCYAEAAEHAGEGSRLFEQLDDAYAQSVCLTNWGAAELELGDRDAATTALMTALRIMQHDPFPGACSYCFEGLAAVMAERGQPRTAARLIGAADAINAQTNFALQGYELGRRARTLTAIQDTLTAQELDEARAEGLGLTLADAVATALALELPSSAAASSIDAS